MRIRHIFIVAGMVALIGFFIFSNEFPVMKKTATNTLITERLAEEIIMVSDSTPTGVVTAIEYMDAGLSRARVKLDAPLIGEVDATFCSPYLTSISGSLGIIGVGDMVRLKKYRYNQPTSEGSGTNFSPGNNGEWIICQQLSTIMKF